MRIAIDATSVTNLSGRRVLLGHLAELVRVHGERHHFVVLMHQRNRDLIISLGGAVQWHCCPPLTVHWTGRALWQLMRLEALLRRQRIDLLISPTGALVPGTALPQIVLAQNPWCFIGSYHRNPLSLLKAALQRRAYREAQRGAWALFANSRYLAGLYAANAALERREPVLFNGIDEAIFAAAQPRLGFEQRRPDLICVSVMTPHKAIEDVIAAFALLRDRGVECVLHLIGPWAQAHYRQRIERLITAQNLQSAVVIHGQVSDDQLRRFYREARVFTLLSRCESFGLPALEAQAFGTPTVVADAAAAPEVAGPGGVVVPPGDALATASALQRLLADPAHWQQLSEAACRNAERFRWQHSSAPLVQLLSQIR